MSREVVYRLSDGLVLRYGYQDFAASPAFDPATERILVSNFIFDPGPPLGPIAWWWDGLNFTQVNPWVNVVSLLYQGVNQYVDYQNPPALQLVGPMTVSAWLKGAPQNDRIIVGKWEAAGNQRGWAIRSGQGVDAALLDVILSATGSAIDKQYRTSLAILDSTWRHIAFSFNANLLRLYIDGAEDVAVVRVIDNAVPAIHNTTANFATGALIAPAAFYQGNQDEVSLWGAVLTAAEIAEVYNGGVPTDLSLHSAVGSLVAWWRDGDGDTFPTLIDQVGTADGTMTAMGPSDIVADVP